MPPPVLLSCSFLQLSWWLSPVTALEGVSYSTHVDSNKVQGPREPPGPWEGAGRAGPGHGSLCRHCGRIFLKGSTRLPAELGGL